MGYLSEMVRRPNTVGGGAQTNLNGLEFERNSDILKMIETQTNYTVRGQQIFDRQNTHVGTYFEKHNFYKEFLQPRGVDFRNVISSKLLPDGVIVTSGTVYVVEMKYQNGPGSVDEKLQTCDFKKKQYQKLCYPIGYRVEYIYLLNDWFNQQKFLDVFEYINSVGCHYFIGTLPLEIFGF